MQKRNLMCVATEREIFHCPFRSQRKTCCGLPNQRIIISKVRNLSRLWDFHREQHISFEKQCRLGITWRIWSFFLPSLQGKGSTFPSQKNKLWCIRGSCVCLPEAEKFTFPFAYQRQTCCPRTNQRIISSHVRNLSRFWDFQRENNIFPSLETESTR